MNTPWQKRIATLFLVLSAALVSLTQAYAQRRERVVESWRPLHYEVTIAFNEQLSTIESATTMIQAKILKNDVRTIDLDFADLTIDSVKVGDQPVRFEQKSDRLDVALGKPANSGSQINITVTYHGKPKNGLILKDDRDGNPSATGDNWPNRVHDWIPCLDHPSAKATVSFTVAAPLRYLVVANGTLVTMTRNGTAPSVWRYEETKAIPPYCMVIAVNQGVQLEPKESAVTPLIYYVSQKDRAYAIRGFSPAAPALALYSETIAPYPYEKLALIIGATQYGGMENSSAIVFTSTLFDARPGEPMSKRFGIPTRIEEVVAHEIAHQWFGDTVTESTWADLWLSEGFATYFAGLFVEKYESEDAFRQYLRHAAQRYFQYELQRRVPIHDNQTEDLNDLLNPTNYEKAAWVLHMLRKRLGDEAFFAGLRIYYNAHREANATTEDLREALEKSSGQNLKEFFARWIYQSGHPKYEISWVWKATSAKSGVLVVTLQQLQPDEAFLDPVSLEVVIGKTAKRLTFQPSGKTTVQEFQLSGKPTALRIDPEDVLLKEVAGVTP